MEDEGPGARGLVAQPYVTAVGPWVGCQIPCDSISPIIVLPSAELWDDALRYTSRTCCVV